ncbi:Fatty acyl-CoA reductase [Corchorus olitorius]|uniref:Fatty acyl-CoA reductase n=1 Tax=Corchorus olitorius TaxID=93759 RepID=A0A1R3HEV6_9ROSI|nr:Fatty acyl-CoA reductase [Corchorus olitorius]
MKFFDSVQDFSAQLWKQVANLPNQVSPTSTVSNTKLFKIIKVKEQAEYLGAIYLPYNFQNYWFDDSNVQGLIKSMSEEEKKKFGCDVKSIEWKDYIVNVHIPGLRRHILKEKGFSKM